MQPSICLSFYSADCVCLTGPELSPIEFNNLWLLCDPAIHTLVVGAARPQDFDDHVQAILKYEQRGELVPPIETKLNQVCNRLLS